MTKPLTVGITFFLRKQSSIWSNGADQNCVFLWMLMKNIPGVGRVIAINGGEGENPPPGMMVEGMEIEWAKPEDVIDQLDIIIEAGAQLSSENVEKVRKNGGKAISYKFGNAFVIDAERVIHNKDAGSIFNGTQFDEVWTTPQHMHTCASYWETMYRCPVRVVPHIWEPLFVNKAIDELPAELTFGYSPKPGKKNVVVFEPNINIVKTCTIPLLACEEAHRKNPDALKDIYVTNALSIKEHLTFKKFAENLDIVKDRKASFEARFNTPWFMAKFGDIVVSHQWENALNYAYYDVLYGEYPLIHNSEMLPDGVGYRYHGFNAQEASRVLLDVIENHDKRIDEYRENIRSFLSSVLATGPISVEAHRKALSEIVGYPLEG